jgi:hypothetical protein
VGGGRELRNAGWGGMQHQMPGSWGAGIIDFVIDLVIVPGGAQAEEWEVSLSSPDPRRRDGQRWEREGGGKGDDVR